MMIMKEELYNIFIIEVMVVMLVLVVMVLDWWQDKIPR